MRVVSVVGARPEFVQVAVLSRVLRRRHQEILVHTGQHYDATMSSGFFDQLGIPQPDFNLGVASLGAAAQVGDMLRKLAPLLERIDPDLVIVRGDTNSTLAGALAAKALMLPLAHVEAGMRSYDKTTPEELNRVIADHIADIFLVIDESAVERLAAEGIRAGVHVCGDVMYDLYEQARPRADAALSPMLRELASEPFDLLTLHRGENVDDAARLRAIVAAFEDAPRRAIFPVHPRTRSQLERFQIDLPATIAATEPLGYLEMVALESRARAIFTDSGGVQREAYFAGIPCVTLRDRTEWTNTVDAGWNRLAGANGSLIRQWIQQLPPVPFERPPLFGDGRAAERIVAALESPQTSESIASARATRAARTPAAR